MAVKKQQPRSSRLDALRIKVLCSMIVKLTNADVESRLHARGLPLSMTSFILLNILDKQSSTLQELSKRMILTPVTLLPIVDDMVKMRFLVRSKDAADKRKSPISITPGGSRILRKARSACGKALIFEATNYLGTKKSKDLCRLLITFVDALTKDPLVSASLERNISHVAMRMGE